MESHDEERLMYKNVEYGNSNGGYDASDLETALRAWSSPPVSICPSPAPK